MMSTEPGDLTVDELSGVLATIFGKPIQDYLIIVNTDCDNCGHESCAPMGMISSRDGMTPDGTVFDSPAFRLHLLAQATEALAKQWNDETADR